MEKTRKHEIFKIHDTNTKIFNTRKYKHEIVKSNPRKTENTKFIKKSELYCTRAQHWELVYRFLHDHQLFFFEQDFYHFIALLISINIQIQFY